MFPVVGFRIRAARHIKRSSSRKVGFHEFLRIEDREGSLVYVALPKGAKAETDFRYVEAGEQWVRFHNPEHDFPRSIKYALTGDTLHIEVRGDAAGTGEKGFDLDLKRQP